MIRVHYIEKCKKSWSCTMENHDHVLTIKSQQKHKIFQLVTGELLTGNVG